MISMQKAAETTPASLSQKGVTRRSVHHDFVVELSEIAKLAFPIVLTQLGQVAMMATDLVFIGRIGAEAVAAAALAGRIYFVSVTFGMGLLAASASFAAEAFGANSLTMVRRSLRMGLWTALLLSLPIVMFQLHGAQILVTFGQAPDAARLAQQYLSGMAWGVAPALSFLAIRAFMSALDRPKPVLWITLAAIPTNALLVYLLMYGKLGLPRLELFGVGLATTIVNSGAFLSALWLATMSRAFRDYHALAQLWRFDWSLMWQLIVLGTPISIALLMECGVSSAGVLMIGLISSKALAANQVALHVGAILFTISSGISTAATVRVAHAVGRNDGAGIKRTGLAAMLLGIVVMAVLIAGVVAARFEIAKFFLGESVDHTEATIGLAADILMVGAGTFISAALYTIASGSLRALKDTWVPLLFSGIAYWPIGFSVSYLLGLQAGVGAIGVWIGSSFGAAAHATLLVIRFQVLASRIPLHTVAADDYITSPNRRRRTFST